MRCARQPVASTPDVRKMPPSSIAVGGNLRHPIFAREGETHADGETPPTKALAGVGESVGAISWHCRVTANTFNNCSGRSRSVHNATQVAKRGGNCGHREEYRPAAIPTELNNQWKPLTIALDRSRETNGTPAPGGLAPASVKCWPSFPPWPNDLAKFRRDRTDILLHIRQWALIRRTSRNVG